MSIIEIDTTSQIKTPNTFKWRLMSSKLILFFSALLMLPVFLYATTTTMGNRTSCNIYWADNTTSNSESIINEQTAFTFYSLVFGFLGPLAFILIFYVLGMKQQMLGIVLECKCIQIHSNFMKTLKQSKVIKINSFVFLLRSYHKTAIRGTSRPGAISKQEEVTQESDEAGPNSDHSLYHLLASSLGHTNSSHKVRN